MKKHFKKSYKLGITAGMLSGVVMALLLMFLLPLTQNVVPAFFNGVSIFIVYLFMYLLSAVGVSSLFVALINVLPSSNIVIKVFVFNTILNVLFIPLQLLAENQYTLLGHVFISIVSYIIFPLLFAFLYLLLAKKSSVAKANTGAFTGIVILVLFLVFVIMVTLISLDVLNFGTTLNDHVQEDHRATEIDIFDKVNARRAVHGLKPLTWSNGIYPVSKGYSTHLINTGSFAHVDENQKNHYDRFKENNLYFFSASEVLAMEPAFEEDLAESVVQGWMDSPGHRATLIDRDELYTHAAVGVSCNKIQCIATMNFAAFEVEDMFEVGGYEFQYVGLNDESLGLEGTYPVLIQLDSNRPINIFFFESFEDVETSVFEGETWNPTSEFYDEEEIAFQVPAKMGSYLVFTSSSFDPVSVDFKMTYNQVVD